MLPQKGKTLLFLNNVSKVFPDGTLALKNVDLEIPKGQFLVILGPSGSGKSTLINTINGAIKLTEGSVTFSDEANPTNSANTLRKQLGVIFQEFNLIENLSSINNVLTGLLFSSNRFWSLLYVFTKAQRLLALEALHRVGLLHKAYARVSTLSGGQKQRIGIARAIIKKPTVLLADEPVASLDPVIARDILALIRDLSKEFGITVVCSLHQVDLALQFSDRIVGLHDGEIILDEKPEHITNKSIQTVYGAGTMGLTFGGENASE